MVMRYCLDITRAVAKKVVRLKINFTPTMNHKDHPAKTVKAMSPQAGMKNRVIMFIIFKMGQLMVKDFFANRWVK